MADIFADTEMKAVVAVKAPEGGADSIEAAATVTPNWDLPSGPNGGYLASLAWRGMLGVLDAGMSPVSFNCQYLAPVKPGDAVVTAQAASRTKRTAVGKAELLVNGTPAISALARFASGRDGLEIVSPEAVAPAAPAPDRLRSLSDLVPAIREQSFNQNLDFRLVSDESALPDRQRVRPYFLTWARFEPTAVHDDELVDIVRVLVLADMLIWPAAERFYRGRPTHLARSTDLAVSFSDTRAMTPWLLCEGNVMSARAGVITGSMRLWSENGQLVAAGLSNMYCGGRR